MRRQLSYWRTTLADTPAQLLLPTDRDAAAGQNEQGAQVPIRIPASTHAGLVAAARRGRASLFMVVNAIVAGLLTRLGSGTDVPLGTVIAGRTDRAVEQLVGFFVNTLVLRVDTSGRPTVRELITRARATALDAYAHADVPFERLVEALSPEGSPGRHPLFQVAVTLDRPAAPLPDLNGLHVTWEPIALGAAKFDLSFALVDERDADGSARGIGGVIEYRTGLFEDRKSVV